MRDRRIVVRVTSQQEAAIKELAGRSNLSLSEYIRAALLFVDIAAANPRAIGSMAADQDEARPVKRVVVGHASGRRAKAGAPRARAGAR